MRKPVGLLFILLVFSAAAMASDITLTPVFQAGNLPTVYDLTKGDISISYTLDLSNVAVTPSYTEVGLRDTGTGSNFNPNAHGGWMASTASNLSQNNTNLDLNDKHNLQNTGGHGETDYNATDPNTVTSAFGTNTNYGIWFDRGGVDASQAAAWGAVNGGTYNTNGIYNIILDYHAISATEGSMFATVNGIQTGFYTAGYKNAQPDIYPAGLSFGGDMQHLQLFYGLYDASSAGGNVTIRDLQVSQVPEPGSLLLLGSGIASLCGLRRRFSRSK